METPIYNPDRETLDDLLHGELRLIQPKRGYRYSVDALLLAHFALPAVAGQAVLDLGTGSGVIALILAKRGRPLRVTGVELQPGLAELARRNAKLNQTRPPVEMVEGDAAGFMARLPAAAFSAIVTNPPFRPPASGEHSPDPEKALAKHELRMTLPSWLEEARRLIRDRGRLCLIYPVDQEPRLRSTLRELEFHIARQVYALDRPEGNRKFILLELQTGSVKTELLPDLPIQTSQGKFSLDGYR